MLQRLGTSLAQGKGFAPFLRIAARANLTRALAFGLPGLALAAAVSGLWLGLGEPLLSGLSLEAPGGHVQWVDPASLAWEVGIRPGQVVVESVDALAPGGWSVVTAEGTVEHAVRAAALRVGLRVGLVGSVAALALGLVGLVAARRRRRRAELLGALGMAMAWFPLAASHDLVLGPWLGAIAAPIAGLWLARWVHRGAGTLVVALASVLDAGWIAARIVDSPTLPQLDGGRFALTILGALAITAISLGMTVPAISRRAQALHDADVVALVSVVGVVLVVQIVVDPPVVVPLLIVVAAAIAYRTVRGGLRAWIDRAIFAEERERATILSAESERARLSRELHDDPLQSLVSVIRSLEDQPGTERHQETLRGVAEQLRHIASNLHPPVLDDLGLVPAVESLFADAGPVPVMLELDNDAGFTRADRPPFDVELAAYRIIQEAATNAIRHSGCGRIVIRGRISAETLAIEVADNGSGIRDSDVDAALRDGHLGMASMRRRAESIDARLVHATLPGEGTTVSLHWSR
jgi:signal transduction histidine kinase